MDPEALVVYGTKAFPNVALLRLLAAEGLGADVSTARRARVRTARRRARANGSSSTATTSPTTSSALQLPPARSSSLDALDEVARAQAAGVATVLIRVTPGIEAETHEAIQTAHAESKFGLVADDAVAAVRDARSAGLDVAGLHVHIGSQLTQSAESLLAVERLADVALRCRAELDWAPRVFDLGGGLARPALAGRDRAGAGGVRARAARPPARPLAGAGPR